MQANLMVISIVVAYMLFMLWIGWYSSTKVRNNADFMVAGRRLGPLMMAGTLAATEIGGGSSLGVVQNGMSGFGLSEEIHTTRKEAEEYIREYFLKHPKVKEYLDSRIELARTKGYAETILGRKRLIREISSPNYMLRQFGERLAMNTPIQGSAADIIKLAMNKVYRELKDKYPGSRLILQIHDELIIEADTEDKEEIAALLRRSMEEAVELSVKLTVELNTSDNWYDLK